MPPAYKLFTPAERRRFQVRDNIYCVGRGLWGQTPALSRDGGCNVWLIDGGAEMALIDAGMAEGVPDLLRNIRRLGFDLRKITKILITHGHWDHILGLPALQKRLNPRVFAPPLAAQTILGKTGIYAPSFTPPHLPGMRAHQLLHPGDRIAIGESALTVIALPGHTPDGLGFELRQGREHFCFSGDTAIGDQPGAKGVIGWIDAAWNSRPADHALSLKALQRRRYTGLFAGHGQAILGAARVAASLRHCRWRLDLFRRIPQLGTMTAVNLTPSRPAQSFA